MLNKKIAVALSGGLDSSVCCHLLKKQGYEVVGITAKMVDDDNFAQVVSNAKAVAEKLEIVHYVLDLTDDFKKDVIEYFEDSYKNGKTPNPCIVCNKTIKFGKILDFAINELGADKLATGHYAKITNENEIFKLLSAKDLKKDQLYYLFELTQEQLSRTIFPLADFVKEDIRKIAIENDLPSKSSKESQDICFIKKPMTTKKYLIEKFGVKKGDFIHIKTGEKLGVHEGFYQYTTGQRKGIGIAYTEPLYVAKIDAANNIVYAGSKDDIYESEVNLRDIKIQCPTGETAFNALVKIRYNMDFVLGFVEISGSSARITFKEPVSAVTSGQAAVFYSHEEGHLIGGGWIV